MDFGVDTFVTDESIRPDVLARALEERGFGALFLAEHSHIPASRESPWPSGGELPRKYYRTLDPFVALTAAAGATERLLLGTGIALVVQRDVIHTAKEVASLDLLSGGRALFGVGVGWNREEMRDHGTDPRTRGALLDEQLAAIKALWTQELAEFHGSHVDFDPTYMWPKPVQQPHPPVYVGGESKGALARLAAYGDAWLPRPSVAPAEIRQVLDRLADQGRTGVGVTAYSVGAGVDVDAYRDAGVERLSFRVETMPEAETLRALDDLVKLVEPHR